MMTEICQYLKNWFDRGQPKYYGTFIITDGAITLAKGSVSIIDANNNRITTETSDTLTVVQQMPLEVKNGQYIRIIGSALNDGVWKIPQDVGEGPTLSDEEFEGAVWLLAIPPAVVAVAKDIADWQKLYGGVDGQNMGPYTSESFAGYSYTKQQGGTTANGTIVNGWIAMFGNRLAMWKKL